MNDARFLDFRVGTKCGESSNPWLLVGAVRRCHLTSACCCPAGGGGPRPRRRAGRRGHAARPPRPGGGGAVRWAARATIDVSPEEEELAHAVGHGRGGAWLLDAHVC